MWLSPEQCDALHAALIDTWQQQGPGGPVLFSWLDWLRGSALEHLLGPNTQQLAVRANTQQLQPVLPAATAAAVRAMAEREAAAAAAGGGMGSSDEAAAVAAAAAEAAAAGAAGMRVDAHKLAGMLVSYSEQREQEAFKAAIVR